MTAIQALGAETDPFAFFWGDETYLRVAWNHPDHQLEGEIAQPDIAAVDPWGTTRIAAPLTGQPATSYDMKQYTVYETLAHTPYDVPFTVTAIAFCPLTAVLGVLFTLATGAASYNDGVSVSEYTGFAVHAWPVSSSGQIGNPLLIGNKDFDGHSGITTYDGHYFEPNAFVVDGPTRLRLLEADIANDLVLNVTSSDVSVVSGPATFMNVGIAWGNLDACENYEGESWYVSGNVVAKVAKNSAGARVRSVDLVGAGFEVDTTATTLVRVNGDEVVVMTTYGLDGFSYPDCSWACFIVKGGAVSKIDLAWTDVFHQYKLVDTPLDEFTTLVVLRADVNGGGTFPWPTQIMGIAGGTYMIGAFSYPALTVQDLDWQALLAVPIGGSAGESRTIVRPTMQGAIVVVYMDDGGVKLIQVGGAAAGYIKGAAHFDR